MTGTVLVTGGAGYIGSHCVWALRDIGRAVVVLDDLSTGVRANLPPDVPLVVGDVGDTPLLDKVLRDYKVQAIIHFAGKIVVPESVANPLLYYRGNTVASHSLISAAVAHGVPHFIFSSTAAVYGAPEQTPIAEDAPLQPINPYGASKLMTERMLADASTAHGLRAICLRYFNVAGADPQGRTGQSTPAATHLIKVACQAAVGKRAQVSIFGTDYPTRDGTGIRDYIHVADLIAAHLLALEALAGGHAGGAFNCGYGRGFSVREVLEAVAAAAGRSLNIEEAGRRAGDPPELVARADAIRALGWQPRYDNLEQIVTHALAWERQLA